MLEEAVTGLLANFGTDGVFRLLALLEEFGDSFETGVGIFLYLFRLLNIV